MMAVSDSDAKLVKLLIDYGAKVDILSPSFGFGAARIAVTKLDAPMLKLLLDAGANPHARSSDGDTPMSGLPERSPSNEKKWDAVTALVTECDQKAHQ